MKRWAESEIALLKELRARFLARTAGAADYWKSDAELALYDATFGERIGWKWDAVLAELAARGWQPQSRRVLDWGCGSGIAGRRVLAQWPQLEALALHDRSPRAVRFAMESARRDFPAIAIRQNETIEPGTLLVLSHVLSELPDQELARLRTLARAADEILWVEAGTHADSRRLITEIREPLRDAFAPVAPCTHRAQCGLLVARNAPHWCHHFAPVPAGIFQDARWMEFGRAVGIDLRALPYSYLVLERPREQPPTPPEFSRVIGRPREAKGYAKVLSCREEGVREWMLQKRDAPELFRAFHDRAAGAVYRWEIEGERIVGAQPFPEFARLRGCGGLLCCAA